MRALAVATVVAVTSALAALGPGPAWAEEPACTGGFIPGRPAALGALGIDAANAVSTGRGVTVAVVDSGVVGGNEHFQGALVDGYDFEGGDGRRDSGVQGTMVAGIVAARDLGSKSGVAGVAPDAMIMPVRVYQPATSGETKYSSTAAASGIEWAIDHGAKVIVVALPLASDPALLAAVHKAKHRALIVAMAGNTTQGAEHQMAYPAGYTDTNGLSVDSVPVVSVTAVDAGGLHQDSTVTGAHVELAAPGMNVRSAAGKGDCERATDKPDATYATAYVAGVAALVAAAHPGEDPVDWKYRLLATASRPSSKFSTSYGWGVVAPYEALNFTNDGSVAGPPNPRFDQPAKPPAAVGEMPAYATDYTPQVWTVLIWALGALVVVVSGGLLVARLKQGR